jgi:hypothetical protein
MSNGRLFQMWMVGSLAGGVAAAALPDQLVYSDALQNGWQNWSWASTSNTTRYAHGGSASLAVTAAAWQAAYFDHDAQDAGAFTNLVLWLHGGPTGGQRLRIQGLLSGTGQTATNLPALAANTWQQYVISLKALGVANAIDFTGFWIADRTGGTQATFYVDDISLTGAPSASTTSNATVLLAVDAQADQHPISPLIYGVAFASSNQLADLNSPLNRSGGNGESRYNWQLNAHNHAADWYFESLADSPATAGAEGDAFVADSRNGHGEAMLTVSAVGWVAKLGANRGRLASYSIAKYGAQTGNDAQWFADAGDGVRASDNRPITWNDPNDANLPSDVAFQSGWLQHLTNRWGWAGRGGVRYYLIDNEPSLWHSTHCDVHPTGATMREVRDKFIDYAAMVKQLDPGALVAGPEEWGWSGYFYSGYDQQAGATNGWSRYPDRSTNGGWDYLPWFLDQARLQAAGTGRRLLDIFTVHYYPQGGEFSDDTSSSMQLRRNRSTRSLWDTNYVDATWINDRIKLIPRLKSWVAAYYPGTQTGITEYNWGAESHANGGTTQADVLGIFGREGLDVATRWTAAATNTPVHRAFKMYRNYDGHNSAFGDISVRAVAPNPDELAVFGAVRSSDGALTVMAIHKRLTGTQPVTVQTTNFNAGATVQVWQLVSNAIVRLPDASVVGGSVTQVLPPQSVTLLVAAAQTKPRLRVGSGAVRGTVQVQLEGQTGRSYTLYESQTLTDWRAVSTNTLSANPLSFNLPTTSAAPTFYQARETP